MPGASPASFVEGHGPRNEMWCSIASYDREVVSQRSFHRGTDNYLKEVRNPNDRVEMQNEKFS